MLLFCMSGGRFFYEAVQDRTGPYALLRKFAVSHRAEQSPAPTKSQANSYCFADFERKAFLPQI